MSSVFSGGENDPGDTFASIYDDWERYADVNRIDEWHESRLGDISAAAEEIRETGVVPPWLARTGGAGEEQFVTLAAIDLALSDCHPRRGGTSYGALTHLATRRTLTGSFSTSAVPGAVIARWAQPARPGEATDRLVDAFRAIVRVQEHQWRIVSPVLPRLALDLSPDVGTSLATLKFVFAPFFGSVDDIEIEQGVGMPGLPDSAWYRVRPVTSRAVERIPSVLECLDASGAQIAVLPEAVIDGDVLAAWQDELRSTRRPAGSALRWLLIGSGPFPVDGDDRPTNTAFLLHRDTGDEILRHDKFAPFHFEVGQPDRWGFGDVLPAGVAVHENIYRGRHAPVLESKSGRLAVLVCEDVTRSGEPIADAFAAVGPSVVIVPVFARATRPWYWQDQAARRHTTLYGATVAVGNSFVVPDAERRAGVSQDGDADGDGFCLLASAGREYASHDSEAGTTIGVLSPGEQCVVLEPPR